jgi:peptidoglycan/xylan/chitin deacetylase (PgdA/CDA1 family)
MNGMVKKLKSLLGFLLFISGLYESRFRNRATVVLFHRVDDRHGGDALSVTVAEFERYCRFFLRHFDVIDLPSLLARLGSGADISRTLVITFDDGYSDNAETAAPVLQRLGLPACFFVTTAFIGSNTVPWWDEKLPVKCRWMTWDDVRSLENRGFDIGSHTVNHVDLGQVDTETAEWEATESRRRIEAETCKPAHLFAYPYGGRERISDGSILAVRAAGFRCCLSAFGGFVNPGDDPFRLKRFSISNYYSGPYEFGLDVARYERGGNVAAARTS